MTLYRIKDWEKHYEISDTKKVQGALQWVAVRTKTDGFGYARITLEKDRTDLLAAWYLMLGVAAKQPKGERGKIARDGIPLTAEDLEMLTRFPAKVFDRALLFFSDPKQGWLVSESIRGESDETGCSGISSEPSGSTVQDSTGQNNTGQDAPDGAEPSVVMPAKFDCLQFTQAWAKWVETRKRFKKPKAGWSDYFQKQMAFLEKYDVQTAVQIVETSDRNEWQGLFEPKGAGKKQGASTGEFDHAF